jgi:hypothetical protein
LLDSASGFRFESDGRLTEPPRVEHDGINSDPHCCHRYGQEGC